MIPVTLLAPLRFVLVQVNRLWLAPVDGPQPSTVGSLLHISSEEDHVLGK